MLTLSFTLQCRVNNVEATKGSKDPGNRQVKAQVCLYNISSSERAMGMGYHVKIIDMMIRLIVVVCLYIFDVYQHCYCLRYGLVNLCVFGYSGLNTINDTVLC